MSSRALTVLTTRPSAREWRSKAPSRAASFISLSDTATETLKYESFPSSVLQSTKR